jgi:hypothetical protein
LGRERGGIGLVAVNEFWRIWVARTIVSTTLIQARANTTLLHSPRLSVVNSGKNMRERVQSRFKNYFTVQSLRASHSWALK